MRRCRLEAQTSIRDLHYITGDASQKQTEPSQHPLPQLISDLKKAADTYSSPVFTTALIAGDDVILHAIHKAGILDKIKVWSCTCEACRLQPCSPLAITPTR